MAAADVPGWMDPDELDWLAGRAAESPVVVELGSWKGRSAAALASTCPGAVFCVDWFRGAEGSPCYGEAEQPDGPAKVKMQFLANLAGPIEAGKLFLLEMTTRAARPFLGTLLASQGGADFIFVDADHSVQAVMEDLRDYRTLVRPGGILAGHDFHMAGVAFAVREMLPGFERGPGRIWFWRKPGGS
jgi:predicted O-methyltransferase YrrM